MKVTFYRSVLNSNGYPYNSPCGSINYTNISDEAIVLKDAINQFEKDNDVENWQEAADFYEIS
ncbi:MAG: hypothetical protein LC106_10515 [Burkholderiales bacterium]|nr:hypothetical protein [Burkholderiales bacterium]